MSVAPETASSSQSSSAYRPILELARGGMGVVQLAVREEGDFRRVYAVKRLRAELREDLDVRTMFIDEARLAGLIRHRNVVSVLDVGEDEDGPYQVMDFVEGSSAYELLKRQPSDEPLPLRLVLDIAIQTCRGLHAAHEVASHRGEPLNLVHRDVSPQNILLGFDGGVRVTDFGVAKAMGRQTQTSTGILKGKLGYMSPEQLRFREPDRRSDLFAVGVVLFELLSGRRLYRNSSAASAPLQILEHPIPDVGEYRDQLPPALVALTMELLAKDREQRPATAEIVADRLQQIDDSIRETHLAVDLGAFLQEQLGDSRRALRAELDAGLASLNAPATEVDLEVGRGAVEGPRAHSSREEGARSTTSRRTLALGIAFGLLAAFGLVMVGMWFGSHAEAPRQPESVPPAATPAPVGEQVGQEATEAEPPQPRAEPDSVREEVREEEEQAPSRTSPAPSPSPRRARRQQRRRTPEPTPEPNRTRDGLPILSWD